MSEIKTVKAMKKIVVRKPGSVRLTAMCNQYGYNNCCCV
ncbi:hypothetical protein IW245_003520 [Longispora fulva]|uniref:Uncharacterized protein n=1 Tax=Longispora fulva TaxID=619741 RepID=A0A8J7GU33_9ACTN|nr:hypothetical protein [Longispora fulva]